MSYGLDDLLPTVRALRPVHRVGHVRSLERGMVRVSGLCDVAAIGDEVRLAPEGRTARGGEVISLTDDIATIMPDGTPDHLQVGDPVFFEGPPVVAPHASWLGRVIDPHGQALDGGPLLRGPEDMPLAGQPINPAQRRALGARLSTGLAVFDTLLPVVRGQRIGLFAGSGVGKSTLLGRLATGLEADVVVVALVGERGREVREFVERVLGPTGMARAVVVAATADCSPLTRRRCAAAAMSVAEFFRDQGAHVLLFVDSVTRFAEAHREVALAAGEPPSLRGYPPSLAQAVTSLSERAGPGTGWAGDITAVFSVLVAGSDMEEPVADILRGTLDGHVVLDRRIAERGRFPAIDVLRSVSRALPDAASPAENELIAEARRRLGAYEENRMMIRAGLYSTGTDPAIDLAISSWPHLDGFIAEPQRRGVEASFARLRACLAAGEGRDDTATEEAVTPVDGQAKADPADPASADAARVPASEASREG